eukprot:272686-Pleurochrysis_carterae.AAC.2
MVHCQMVENSASENVLTKRAAIRGRNDLFILPQMWTQVLLMVSCFRICTGNVNDWVVTDRGMPRFNCICIDSGHDHSLDLNVMASMRTRAFTHRSTRSHIARVHSQARM